MLPLINCAFWKIGEPVVSGTLVVPSKTLPLEKVSLRGTIVTGTVVVAEPFLGLVPTMLNLYVVPPEVNDDRQCFRYAPASCVATARSEKCTKRGLPPLMTTAPRLPQLVLTG